MSHPAPPRALLASLVGLLIAVAAGCGGESSTRPIVQPIDPLPGAPLNDTPSHALARFEAAYESRVLAEYGKLLASDFRFTFSSLSDPNLVSQYGENWGKDDEIVSTSHLFGGFTNDLGEYQPAAARITLALFGTRLKPDPAHADSTAHYVLADSIQVAMRVELAGAEGIIYDVVGPHRAFLVRGDAAFALDPGQIADSTRWYVRRWEDHTPALGFVRGGGPGAAPATVQAASPATWGRLRAQYR